MLKQIETFDINTGIMSLTLFVSPEVLLLPTQTKIFDELIKIKMLKPLRVEEVHLIIDFGLSFLRKFLSLREEDLKLVKTHVINGMQKRSTDLIKPLLCMNSTFH